MKQKMNFNLLTVMGKVKPKNVNDTRELHNNTAGHPDGVAAAKHLGDLSHMVYMNPDAETNFNGQLLFLDIWNDLEGMNNFFSDEQVQGGANMMFETREAMVWSKLDTFLNYSFPSPTGHNDRIVGIVRGFVKSLDEAAEIHNKANAENIKQARAFGLLSHEFYVRLAAPGSPEALEVIGIDVWNTGKGAMDHYQSPLFQNSGLYNMFASKPTSSIWQNPKGEWVEW